MSDHLEMRSWYWLVKNGFVRRLLLESRFELPKGGAVRLASFPAPTSAEWAGTSTATVAEAPSF